MKRATKLIALTREAYCALGGAEVTVEQFPFRVGRECRMSPPKLWMGVERRGNVAPQVNDLYLLEHPAGDAFHMSREHFQIEIGDGKFFIRDRGSMCGTLVGSTPLGSDRTGGRVEVHDQDQIVVGTADSPFAFRFQIE